MKSSLMNGYELLETEENEQESERCERKKNRKLETTRMENPHWYLMKALFIYLLVFVDIFLNSSVNSDSYESFVGGRLSNFWPFLFLVVQTSLQLFIFLTLFLLMCNTYLMQIGLPGVVLSDFKFLGAAQLLYIVLTVILGVMRILWLENTKTSSESIWNMGGFQPVFVMQNLSAAIYYHQVLYSTFRLADEKYYTRC